MGLQPCDICFWYSFPFNSFLKNGEGCKQALAIGIEEVQQVQQPGPGMASAVGLLSLGLENWCALRTTQLALKSAVLAVFQKWIFLFFSNFIM